MAKGQKRVFQRKAFIFELNNLSQMFIFILNIALEATVLKIEVLMLHIFLMKNKKGKILKSMIFSDVIFHDQNGYSEEISLVMYHLKTNFLLRNIFFCKIAELYLILSVFCTNVATDLKKYCQQA